MASFARIAVNVPSLAGVFIPGSAQAGDNQAGAFDYEIPEELGILIQPGQLTVVPFGKRQVQGVVIRLVNESAVPQTRAITDIADAQPVMSAQQIDLAIWMSRATLAPLSSIVGLFLPPGLEQQADTLFALEANFNEPVGGTLSKRGVVATRLLRLLETRGPLRGRQIDQSLRRVDWRNTAKQLVRQGLLSARPVLPLPSVHPKSVRTAQLAVPPAAAEAALEDLGNTDATRTRRRKAIGYLIERPEPVDVAWVYAESGCALADLQELAKRDLVVLRQEEIWRDPLNRGRARGAPRGAGALAEARTLTGEQELAWKVIQRALHTSPEDNDSRPVLLQGVTGSGKTELYLRAAAEAVRSGKQVIVLVPEIALTPQTVERFSRQFPGEMGLWHSKLSEGERYDTWRRARAGSLKIIIGARSALFVPLQNVGLVVADECHDASYHQSEPPFYDALEAAAAYSRICHGACILGSATPSVVQRFRGESGEYGKAVLTTRVASVVGGGPASALDLPAVQIVDMKQELRGGNSGIFGSALKNALEEVLTQGEQAILFLNRRGTATYVFCRNCGYVARCPRCETPLTQHTTGTDVLVCHRCGYKRQMLRKCPSCASNAIRSYGLGTERVESEVLRLFPKARTLRWDWETTREKDAHEIILHHFASGHADVLIGTQMLAKGLDFPRVVLVGIVMADVGLFLPDPFAPERVFQVLTQVAGRAGRSVRGGKVILQTYAAENPVIGAAARHDVEGFYRTELDQRLRLGYPPFSRLLRLEYRHHDAVKAEQTAVAAGARLREILGASGSDRGAIMGPAPCFFSKVDGKYRWQIIVRGGAFEALIDPAFFREWRIEADPVSLL
jgi:primosomal protein N' (replication factor Y)